VADTIKRATDDGHSAGTMPREQLWRAQTPQMFRYRQLREALRQARAAGREPTDEAQALEWLGVQPQLVAAQDSNIKITTAEDLAVAAAILAARR
jgi:2-C-methyl-D-erythritol 4-phosphate cytidylyltransferase